MKRLLLILLLLPVFAEGQNWQCLQGGMKHYFVNGNGYLRGIRIDSVRAIGDTTVYYPNHTPRGAYDPTVGPITLDSTGGSWLGKRVLQKSDGTFIFDSYWGDSAILKTHADVGDSWVFYRDTSNLYYKATLIAKDTMTVLSSPDSVQIIMINAYNSSGIVVSDPLDSFKIVLSKDHGFVQVLDLYTFPYHKPDSVYRTGLDFFLDRSTHNYDNVNSASGYSPDANSVIFKLVDFINPNDQQLHNWNVGDTLEGYHEVEGYYTGSYTDYILETVSNKIVSGHSISYTLSGTNYTCTWRPGFCYGGAPYYWDPCTLIINGGVRTFYDTIYSIADTSLIPEENLHIPYYVFYFPDDTSFCVKSPAYVLTYAHYSPDGEEVEPVYYKLGIGETQNQSYDEDCILFYTDELAYTNVQGVSCGTLHAPVSTNNITVQKYSLTIYPNPASTSLTITSSDKITSITITNLLGQNVYNKPTTPFPLLKTGGEVLQVDVAALPAGMYFVKVNNTEVRKFVKQ